MRAQWSTTAAYPRAHPVGKARDLSGIYRRSNEGDVSRTAPIVEP